MGSPKTLKGDFEWQALSPKRGCLGGKPWTLKGDVGGSGKPQTLNGDVGRQALNQGDVGWSWVASP